MTKKIITYLLAFMCICTCFIPSQVIWADAPSASITLSDSSVDVGETITVTLTFGNDTANFSRVTGRLSYDSEIIEFVPQNGMEGGGGMLSISENTTDLTDSIVITLTFQAVKEGSSTFSLQDCQLLDDAGPVGSPTAESKSVTVRNTSTMLSSNANLASLTGPGTWTPEFSPEVTEYTITVENSITNFLVSATAQDSNATINVEGSQYLQVGSNNQRKVVVTAQDGTQKTYTLNITREAPVETATPDVTGTANPTPTPTKKPTNPPEQTQIQWGTPAQDVTDTPDATIENTPTATITPVQPSQTTQPSSGMTVDDLTNKAVTGIVIIAVIVVVILFTIVYCMQQKENKKTGKKKKRK